MASTTVYDPNVSLELARALGSIQAGSVASDSIIAAYTAVKSGEPVNVVMNDIISAMQRVSKVSVLFSLSQAIAWIGPMAE